MDQQNAKVVFCGAVAVGKTAIFDKVLEREFEASRSPTAGAAFAVAKINVDGKDMALNLWDTAGQEEYGSLVKMYFRKTSIAVIVFDLTAYESFEQVDHWYQDVTESCGSTPPKIIIVGNKADLREERCVDGEEIQRYADSISSSYCEVSALTGRNVDELISILGHLAANVMEELAREKGHEKKEQNRSRSEILRERRFSQRKRCC
jgi:small GTP-binding protein